MRTEILISEVEIMRMLMPAIARASNILEATPVAEAMPAPTMETFATLVLMDRSS